jgi:hypothetical protein
MAPVLGAFIDIEYLVTAGSSGNVAASAEPILFQFEDTGKDVNGEEVDLNKYLLIAVASWLSMP